MIYPIAFQAIHDKDTMYFHQAMQQPYKDLVVKSIIKEINVHTKRKHWKLVPCSKVTEGETVILTVSVTKSTKYIMTQVVVKWKSHLNVRGGKN